MKNIKLILLIGLLILFCNNIKAQNSLYLRFDEASEGMFSVAALRGDKPLGSEREFYFPQKIFRGRNGILMVLSINYTDVTPIPLEDLSAYPVVNPDDLENTLASYTSAERVAYISSFDKLYVVEILTATNQAKIVEVEVHRAAY